jgi:general secretion pathway protein A
MPFETSPDLPFETSPDPKFVWFSEKHQEAFASLKYGIQENKGFLLLTGDIGTGKTTLINCFLNENDTDAIIASIPDPDLSIVDFFLLLSKEFNISMDFNTKGEFLIKFENFLLNTYSEQKKALLIIDEAQRLNQQLLEQIRLLSNIEKQYAKLINIFLVGQNELNELIMDEQNKALRQRIAVHYNIEPLTEPETRDYIKHRLRISGSEEEIFSSKAIYEICSFSKGYPRLINTICDRALLTGYVSDIKKINGKIIKKCADELIIPGEKDDTPIADQEESGVNLNKKILFTWDPCADQEENKLEVNERKFPLRKQPKIALLTAIVVLAIWIATVLLLYDRSSQVDISYAYFTKLFNKIEIF